MKRIIVLATDGDSREDGNVYYSNYILVEATANLKFDEDIFEDDAPALTQAEFIAAVRALGYLVDEPDIIHVIVED